MLTITMLVGLIMNNSVNYDFVSICRKEDGIYFYYNDSLRAITEIKHKIDGDSLELEFSIEKVKKSKVIKLTLDKQIKYLRYGDKILEAENIPVCTTEYGGKEAIEYMKNNLLIED